MPAHSWRSSMTFLTAKVAKVLRRGRKAFNINALPLRALRNPLRALRLVDFIQKIKHLSTPNLMPFYCKEKDIKIDWYHNPVG